MKWAEIGAKVVTGWSGAPQVVEIVGRAETPHGQSGVAYQVRPTAVVRARGRATMKALLKAVGAKWKFRGFLKTRRD